MYRFSVIGLKNLFLISMGKNHIKPHLTLEEEALLLASDVAYSNKSALSFAEKASYQIPILRILICDKLSKKTLSVFVEKSEYDVDTVKLAINCEKVSEATALKWLSYVNYNTSVVESFLCRCNVSLLAILEILKSTSYNNKRALEQAFHDFHTYKWKKIKFAKILEAIDILKLIKHPCLKSFIIKAVWHKDCDWDLIRELVVLVDYDSDVIDAVILSKRKNLCLECVIDWMKKNLLSDNALGVVARKKDCPQHMREDIRRKIGRLKSPFPERNIPVMSVPHTHRVALERRR